MGAHARREEIMKTIRIVMFIVLAVSLTVIGIAPTAYATEGMRNGYWVLKGGVYSPSEEYDISNFNSGNTSRIDTKTGFNGEIAVGGYLLPVLALELGVGYFESEGHAAAEPGTTKLKAVPVLVTAKGIIPIGAVELYGEFGLGAYITKLDVDGNFGSFSGESKTTYGVHAGAGFNIDVSDTTFIGLEGRYLRAKPDYGGQPVKLNGFTATFNLGFRH
jgi:opacity protein-like surface antigen